MDLPRNGNNGNVRDIDMEEENEMMEEDTFNFENTPPSSPQEFVLDLPDILPRNLNPIPPPVEVVEERAVKRKNLHGDGDVSEVKFGRMEDVLMAEPASPVRQGSSSVGDVQMNMAAPYSHTTPNGTHLHPNYDGYRTPELYQNVFSAIVRKDKERSKK
ncbi:hypothetical protein SNEBB_007482 [Seison nebaliae]|nr:hypothetical protein SNEBB_007482 [Seison nebaliae]